MMRTHFSRFFENFYVATASGVSTAVASVTVSEIETWLRIAGLAAGLLVTLLAGVAQVHKLYRQWKGDASK